MNAARHYPPGEPHTRTPWVGTDWAALWQCLAFFLGLARRHRRRA